MHKNRKPVLTISWIIFIMYSCLMAWEVFIGPYRIGEGVRRYNVCPFKTIVDYFIHAGQYSPHTLIVNLAANIVTFIPLGFFLPILFKRLTKLITTAAFSVTIITIIESVQYVLNVGVFDVDDIILNTLGCIMGFMLCKIIKGVLEGLKAE